jgi:hypothetical protein
MSGIRRKMAARAILVIIRIAAFLLVFRTR